MKVTIIFLHFFIYKRIYAVPVTVCSPADGSVVIGAACKIVVPFERERMGVWSLPEVVWNNESSLKNILAIIASISRDVQEIALLLLVHIFRLMIKE